LYAPLLLAAGKRERQRSIERLNDVVDMQKIAMGTFLNGLLSKDGEMQEISVFARAALRKWGAYVGEDFPASPDKGENSLD
jgi:hypothetical protein